MDFELVLLQMKYTDTHYYFSYSINYNFHWDSITTKFLVKFIPSSKLIQYSMEECFKLNQECNSMEK